MELLNEFLRIVCNQAHDNDDLHTILCDFLEPDTNDKKISGGSVIRTVKKKKKYQLFWLDLVLVYSKYSFFYVCISDRNNCESI